MTNNDITVDLAIASFQLVCVLIHYSVPQIEFFDAIEKDSHLVPIKEIILKSSAIYEASNQFEKCIKELNELNDIEFLYEGFKRIFENSLETNYERNLYIEAVILITKIAKSNPMAIRYLNLEHQTIIQYFFFNNY